MCVRLCCIVCGTKREEGELSCLVQARRGLLFSPLSLQFPCRPFLRPRSRSPLASAVGRRVERKQQRGREKRERKIEWSERQASVVEEGRRGLTGEAKDADQRQHTHTSSHTYTHIHTHKHTSTKREERKRTKDNVFWREVHPRASARRLFQIGRRLTQGACLCLCLCVPVLVCVCVCLVFVTCWE